MRIGQSVAALPAGEWDALAGGNPFMSHAFLATMEQSGSVGEGTGWQPLPLTITGADGRLAAALPAWLKHHSQGEYVFDHAWADAWARAGGEYYPKLQVAAPFTPATGPRVLTQDPALAATLLAAAEQICADNGLSSAHATFIAPEQAAWLPDDEKAWIVGELERERKAKQSGEHKNLWQEIKEALSKKETILLSAIYLSVVIGYYGITFFIPAIVERMKGNTGLASDTESFLLQYVIPALPYVCGLITMLWNAKHSDQTGERSVHTYWSLFLGAAALGLVSFAGNNLLVATICLCLVGIGVHAYLPVFWTWPSAFMTAAVAATAVGLINSVGNLGGYFGPQVVGQMKKQSGSYVPGLRFLAVSVLVSGLLALLLKMPEKKNT